MEREKWNFICRCDYRSDSNFYDGLKLLPNRNCINGNEVTISLAIEDYSGLCGLGGYEAAGNINGKDMLSAEVGWNVKNETLSAGAIIGVTVTFEP